MKFFLPRACDVFDEDIELFREAYYRYKRHLSSLRGVLTDRVLKLDELPGTDDALIAKVEHDREKRVLRVTLRGGDLQMGYYNLVLTYEGAELLPEHDAALATIARSAHSHRRHGCDLAWHELDVAEDGMIEHRLLFHASEWYHPTTDGWLWFAVQCRALRWRREPRRTRELPSDDGYPFNSAIRSAR